MNDIPKHPKFEDLNPANCREVSMKIHWPEFWSYLRDHYEGLPFAQKIYLFYHNLPEPPKCRCGKPTEFLGYRRGYREFCSYSCMNGCKDIQDRKKETSLKNWGTTNPMQSKEVRDRLQATNQERYGVDNTFQSKELMNKAKATCKERYGTEYANQSEVVKQKILNSKRAGIMDKIPGIINIEPGDGFDIYTIQCSDGACNKCSEKCFKIRSGTLYDRKRLGVDLCTTRYPVGAHIKNTSLERFVKNILDEYSIGYEENNRTILSGKELDIYIPSRKVAIECNGVYWHSMYDSKYHYEKWKVCQHHGIQLLSIWEDWITNKPAVVRSIILSKLGVYEHRIGARRCKVVEVPSSVTRKFLDNNHIQGFCNSTIRYGLEYGGELVALMCFKKGSNPSAKKTCTWDLIRFCSKTCTSITAGAQRLLSHFRQEHPGSIVSYASHDISNGDLYEKLGFRYDGEIQTTYWYVHNQSHERFHRSSFMKKDLVRKGYDPSLTEEQIMMQTDYLRIYDSGMSRYVLDD